MIFNILSAVLSAAALAVSVLVAVRQLQASRRSDTNSAILALFAEYRSLPMRDSRDKVYRLSSDEEPAPPLSMLPDEVREDGFRLAYYFDHLGLLIGHRLLPSEPFVAFLGNGCSRLWLKLKPCIEAERQRRGVRYYLGYFEMLALLSDRQDAEVINHKLIRQALDGGRRARRGTRTSY
ncbi:DUF4760 domain-containing protein [Micromonospora sp. WMMD1219]|uniref:DUF4760 domain-containing protein n=1 Tax=Micromonospora sp. WMMD1219 TaxID=3404115 RepID=UPI003BF53D05